MAQSREPVLFNGFGVPDTVMGRFDMLSMHVFLFVRRLRTEKDDVAQNLGQELFDLYVDDIDRALRQLGIGDTSVPKRKKTMVRSFYGQIEDFDSLLDKGELKKLEKKVADRFLSGKAAGKSRALGKYMLECSRILAAQSFVDLRAGRLIWPDPVLGNR